MCRGREVSLKQRVVQRYGACGESRCHRLGLDVDVGGRRSPLLARSSFRRIACNRPLNLTLLTRKLRKRLEARDMPFPTSPHTSHLTCLPPNVRFDIAYWRPASADAVRDGLAFVIIEASWGCSLITLLHLHGSRPHYCMTAFDPCRPLTPLALQKPPTWQPPYACLPTLPTATVRIFWRRPVSRRSRSRGEDG